MKMKHYMLNGQCIVAFFYGHFLLDYQIKHMKVEEI